MHSRDYRITKGSSSTLYKVEPNNMCGWYIYALMRNKRIFLNATDFVVPSYKEYRYLNTQYNIKTVYTYYMDLNKFIIVHHI